MSSLSEQAYSQAYKLHYNKRNYEEAYKAYLIVIRDFPDSNEARYSKQQIDNLKKTLDLSAVILDPALSAVCEILADADAQKMQREFEEKEKNEARIQAREERLQEQARTVAENVKKRLGIIKWCTTTDDFSNAIIQEYCGTVSGAATYLPGGVLGEGAKTKYQSSGFDSAFSDAKNAMFDQAVSLGANGIVGMSTSIAFAPVYGVIVSVTGTAVKIKKKESNE